MCIFQPYKWQVITGFPIWSGGLYDTELRGMFADRRVVLFLPAKTSCGGGTFGGHVLIGPSLESGLCLVRLRGKLECSYMIK